MTIQDAMANFSKPWMKEFFAMSYAEQATFFMGWYMAVASLKKGVEREKFTDALIMAIQECEKKADTLSFVEVKCATCEDMVEVLDRTKDEVHVCAKCRGDKVALSL